MNTSQLKQVLNVAVNHKRRVLIVGAPGIGKTALVKEVAKEKNATLTVLYASVSDPTDFKGFYCIVDGKPEILPFGELEKIFNADSLHIVFLDDLGQGVPAVQAAAMSFLDKVKDNPNVVVIAATNRREDRANVSGLLEPIKSRFDSIIHVDFNMESFIADYALDNFPIPLVAFMKFRPALMYGQKATADLINGFCPRTAEALSEWIKADLPKELQLETYAGAVGEGVAAEYIAFERILNKMPNFDMILLNPDSVDVPTDPSVIYACCMGLARKTSENTIERLLKFVERMQTEFQVLFIREAVRQDKAICNTKAYIKFMGKNSSVFI